MTTCSCEGGAHSRMGAAGVTSRVLGAHQYSRMEALHQWPGHPKHYNKVGRADCLDREWGARAPGAWSNCRMDVEGLGMTPGA